MTSTDPIVDWKLALQRLTEGNKRFSTGLCSVDSLMNHSRLKDLAAQGQSPFAVVLTCSDSRVPVEIVFDQGIGSLFVIRVAGNVLQPSQLASIEFAVDNLRTSLCVVMGHSQCGAIKAAIEAERTGAPPSSANLGVLLDLILPSVRLAKRKVSTKDEPERLLREATAQNVCAMVRAVTEESPLLTRHVERGSFRLVGALFELNTGNVQFDLGLTTTSSKNVLAEPSCFPPATEDVLLEKQP